MQKKYSYLSKNVLLFSLNGFIPKILSFILIPIYTGYLTEAQYGVSDLITTTVQLLVPIFTIDIQDAVMRYALDNDHDNRDVFSACLKIVSIGTLLVTLGAVVTYFLHIPGIEPMYLVFVVLMFLSTSLTNCFSLFCRGIDQVKVIVIGSVLHSVITLTANILFLTVFHWGLTGFLVANTIGTMLTLVYEFVAAKLYRYIRLSINKQTFREMVSFSFPLIFSVVAWWINNASDHYVLAWISGVATSGLYAIAYKIPNLLSMFQNIFTQAWSISAIKEFDKDDSDGFVGKMYNTVNFAMMLVCSVIIILDVPIAYFLYSNDFFEAWRFVPPLLISVVFNAMALFIGSIFTAVKDTKTLSISTLIGAGINTVCNVVFIYFWGAYGAAIATLIGYGVTLVMRHIILRKHIRMKIHWPRDIAAYAALIAQMIVAYFGWKTIPLQVIATVVLIVLYRKEIGAILKLVKNKLPFLNKNKAD